MVINGISVSEQLQSKESFIQRLMNVELTDIILSNMAYHPQYSGIKLNSVSFNPFQKFVTKKHEELETTYDINNSDKTSYQQIQEAIYIVGYLEDEFLKMKQFAKNNGCCKTNQSLFFIRHIFCDTIKNQLHLASISSPRNKLNKEISFGLNYTDQE